MPRMTVQSCETPEPFVDAKRAAAFLSLTSRRVLDLARRGSLPAHPIGIGQRRVWRFRLSELAEAILHPVEPKAARAEKRK